MLNQDQLNEIAELTLVQTQLRLIHMDVLPLHRHSYTIETMDALLELGYSGRTLDAVHMHGRKSLSQKSRTYGDFKTGNHRVYLNDMVQRHGVNYSYLTARGKIRAGDESRDYQSALKLQLVLELSK